MEKQVLLSDGEWRIMELLWERPRTITELTAALRGPTGWAKATVITILGRMERKGAVRWAQDGRAKRYIPAVDRADAVARATGSFLDKVYRGSAGLQYALWGLALLRLLVPVTVGRSAVSVLNLLPAAPVRTEAGVLPGPAQQTGGPAAPPNSSCIPAPAGV